MPGGHAEQSERSAKRQGGDESTDVGVTHLGSYTVRSFCGRSVAEPRLVNTLGHRPAGKASILRRKVGEMVCL